MAVVSTGQIAIVDVNDGLSAQLTSSSATLPATEAGVVSNYAGAETTFSIYEGGIDTSATWTYYVSLISSGIAYRDSGDTTDRTGTGVSGGALRSNYLKVTSLTAALAYLDVTAVKANQQPITRRYSVVRASTGVTGVRGTITGVKSVSGLNAWSDGEANNAVAGFVTSGTTSPIKGDTITLINTAGTFSETRIYSGAAWLSIAAYISTSQITNNAITADKLAVNSVTASKIIVSDLSNIVKNPIFANGALPSTEGWGGLGTATAVLASDSSVPTGAPAATVLKIPVSATTIYDLNVGNLDVTAGEQYYAECWVATSSDAVVSSGFGIQSTVLDRNNANPAYPSSTSVTGYPQSISTVTTTWTRLIAQIVVPATAGSGTAPGKLLVRFSLRAQPTAAGSVFVTKMVIRKLVNGELIVDGAITTNKMVANTINADRLLVNTITGDKIAANTISANRLLVGDTTMLVENNDFTKGKFSWSDVAGIVSESANAYNGNTFVAKVTALGTYVNRNSNLTPVVPGEVLYLNGVYKTSSDYASSSAGAGFRLSYLNAAGAEVGTPTLTTTAVATGWTQLGNFFTVPAGAAQVRAELISFNLTAGTVYWSYVGLRRGTAVAIQDGTLSAAKIVAKSIGAGQITAGSITTNEMTANTINADRLLAGTISGDKIAANTISATNIGIGDFTNLIANGDLSSGNSSFQAGTVLLDAANAYNGEKYVVVRPANAASVVYMSHNARIPVLSGEEYWFEWYGKATSDATGATNPYMRINDGAGNQIGTPNVGSLTNVNTGWTYRGGKFTVPANATEMYMQISSTNNAGTYYYGYFSLRRRNAGNLLVDGTITATQLAVDSVTAAAIKGGTITGDKLTVNTVSTNKLTVASRPVSTIGLNMRINADNATMSYDAGQVRLVQDDGTVGYFPVLAAGPIPYQGNHMYFFYQPGRGVIDYNTDSTNLGNPGVVMIAVWRGGTDLTVMSGVATSINGDRIVTGSINADRIIARSIKADQLDANSVTADKIKANEVSANKLTAATRPFSAIGLNMRVAADGNVNWDQALVYYAKDDGTVVSGRTIAAGACGAGQGIVRFYFYVGNDATNTNLDAVANNGLGLENHPSYKLVAIWRGGADLTVASGVGTVINGDNIVTGTLNADRIVARSIKTDHLDFNSVTGDNIRVNSIYGNKLTTASRPFSFAGLNMRVEGGTVVWDEGYATFTDNNGAFANQRISSGAVGGGGTGTKTDPMYIIYSPTLHPNSFDYTQDKNYPASGDWKKVATWSGGTDLALEAGVSTIINGDRIVTGTVDANKLVARSILAGNIKANEITTNEIAVGTITADNIKAGTIGAAQIAAGAIVASKLSITSSDNIIPDANMRDTSFWNIGTDGKTSLNDGNAAWVYFPRFMSFTPQAIGGRYTPLFDVEPGATYKVKVSIYVDPNFSGFFNATIHVPNNFWYSLKAGAAYNDPSVNTSGFSWVSTTGSGFVETKDYVLTIPANANAARVQLRFDCNFTAGNVQFNTSMTRVSDATLIQDGAITTNKMVANSINGDRITAGTLSADKISANTIMAGSITIGGVTGVTGGNTIANAFNTATWAGTSGTGKPADNATVGATTGTNLKDVTGAILTDAAVKNNQASYQPLKTYSFDTGVEGFTSANGTLSAANGTITMAGNASTNPIIISTNLSILGSKIPLIRMRCRPLSASPTMNGAVYYETASGNHGQDSNFYKRIVSPGLVQNQWVILEWDMTTLNAGGTDWMTQTITRVRFDIGNQANVSWEIDWITFGNLMPAGTMVGTTLASSIESQTLAATAAITAISADNVLSAGEKPELVSRWNNFSQLWLYARDAASAQGVSYAALDAAKTKLSDFLTAINPSWANYGVDSPINGETLRNYFADCFSALAECQRTTSNKVATTSTWAGTTGTGKPADNATVGAPAGTAVNGVAVETITSAISAITSDNIISPAEKSDLYNLWQRCVRTENWLWSRASEYVNAGKGDRYYVQAKRDALSVASANLSGYINSFGPALNQWEVATPVNGANLRSLFDTYNNCEEPLRVALQYLASESGDWQQVYGTGKPENYTLMARSNMTASAALPGNFAHGLRGSNGEYFQDSYHASLRSDSYSRSYTVCTRVNPTYWAVRHFDVYGGGEVAYADNVANRKGAAGMASYLNDQASGTIVVIYTSDEPANRRLESGLPEAMYRCGASRTTFASPSFNSYSSYTLVGTVGAGEGNGMEMLSSGSANSYVMGSFSVVNNVAMIGGKSLKDATDITFSDGRGVNALIGVQAGATVGAPSGTTIGNGTSSTDVESRANNPAATVNAGTTQIDAGKIVIGGSTSLANWKGGPNNTEINGNAIATNSIRANSITLGNRGINIENLVFETRIVAGGYELCWDAGGYIIWTNSNGNLDNRPIAAGNTYGVAKRCYVYWNEYEALLRVTNDYGTANAQTNIVLATYQGGNIFVANYGGTIINGDRISTGTINADKITAGTITASKLLMSPAMESIITDPGFQDRNFWSQDTQVSQVTVQPTNASWPGAPKNLFVFDGNDDVKRTWFSPMFPVEAGATYRIRYYYYANNVSGNIMVGIHMPGVQWFALKNGVGYDPAGWDGNASVFQNTGSVISKEYTITNSTIDQAKTWQFRFDAQFRGNFQMFCTITRVSDGTLIADGAITTNKIRVGELNGDRIQAGTLDAGTIKAYTVLSNFVQIGGTGLGAGFDIGAIALAANDPANRINSVGTTINGGKITTGSIDANRLNVTSLSAITANIGLLRTASSGARLEIESNQIRGYYANNQIAFRMGVF